MRASIARSTVAGLRSLARPRASMSPAPRTPSTLAAAARCLSATSPRLDGERQWSTPLAKRISDGITATGPMPLATYMRMCLTSDTGGYYTGAIEGEGRDQFGRKGDFVTSPEISQMFGELVGIWFVAEWISQGRPSRGVELIELGPGRGTLMDDILRTIENFPDMAHAIDAIYMVEASSKLRVAQKNLLCGEDAPMTESKVGYHSICKYTHLPIVWTQTIKSIPYDMDKVPLIVAHEFFDALPIHAFELVNVPANRTSMTDPSYAKPPPPPAEDGDDHSAPSTKTSKSTLQWREMLVTPVPEGATHAELGTPTSQQRAAAGATPDFQLSLAKAHTRHSRHLPESSGRYRALKNGPSGNGNGNGASAASSTTGAPPPAPSHAARGKGTGPGTVIEVSPDLALYAAELATRIGGSAKHPRTGPPAGAALIIDYGPSDGSVPVSTLRGIRLHERLANPFVLPGLVDLSADVDFGALAEAATKASEGVEVHGPVEQGEWLERMGIAERAEALMAQAAEGEEREGGEGGEGEGGGRRRTTKADVEKAWKRLVDRGPSGMGKVYKALAILPENDGRRKPVGFGGDVEA